MDTAIVPSSLHLKDVQEQNNDFVHTTAEFQKGSSSLFHSKTAHLTDIDFVEIDRPILELIGFKNSFIEKKHKNGSTKMNRNGTPIVKDTRSDFSSAIRCLRNTAGFIEGTSLHNTDAHFIVMKNEAIERQNGGQNKQSLWIRKDAFEKWTHVYKITGKTSKNIKNGMVYFIHMEDNLKMFKIGYTTDLNKRLEALQIGNPHLLCTYKTIDNVSRKLETRLHHLFQNKKIRGEWFAITPDMIEFVCFHL